MFIETSEHRSLHLAGPLSSKGLGTEARLSAGKGRLPIQEVLLSSAIHSTRFLLLQSS